MKTLYLIRFLRSAERQCQHAMVGAHESMFSPPEPSCSTSSSSQNPN